MFRKLADLFRTARDTVFPKAPDLNVPVRYTGLPDPVLPPPRRSARRRPRPVAANGARLTVRYLANGHRP